MLFDKVFPNVHSRAVSPKPGLSKYCIILWKVITGEGLLFIEVVHHYLHWLRSNSKNRRLRAICEINLQLRVRRNRLQGVSFTKSVEMRSCVDPQSSIMSAGCPLIFTWRRIKSSSIDFLTGDFWPFRSNFWRCESACVEASFDGPWYDFPIWTLRLLFLQLREPGNDWVRKDRPMTSPSPSLRLLSGADCPNATWMKWMKHERKAKETKRNMNETRGWYHNDQLPELNTRLGVVAAMDISIFTVDRRLLFPIHLDFAKNA